MGLGLRRRRWLRESRCRSRVALVVARRNRVRAARAGNDLVGQGRPLTLGIVSPTEKLQIPLAPGGIVVESASPSEIPVPRKIASPTIEVPDAGAAPSEKCHSGNPLLAS